MCINAAPYLQQKSANLAFSIVLWYYVSLNSFIIAHLERREVLASIFLIMMLNLHQIKSKFVPKSAKLVQIICHKGAATKMHKCLIGHNQKKNLKHILKRIITLLQKRKEIQIH